MQYRTPNVATGVQTSSSLLFPLSLFTSTLSFPSPSSLLLALNTATRGLEQRCGSRRSLPLNEFWCFLRLQITFLRLLSNKKNSKALLYTKTQLAQTVEYCLYEYRHIAEGNHNYIKGKGQVIPVAIALLTWVRLVTRSTFTIILEVAADWQVPCCGVSCGHSFPVLTNWTLLKF